jgi:folate-binding protein YgfZ
MPHRLERAFLRVSGPDAASFLDNLLTQDVGRLQNARSLYAALLTPQGKVIADMVLWAQQDGDAILLELDPTRVDDVGRRLAMYKLRANVTVENVSDKIAAFWNESAFGGATPDPRFPDCALGWRAAAPASASFDLDAATPQYGARRLGLGVPDLARDAAPEEVFALEGLLEELHGVDFQKGCFVGQENVSRMKRRATTRKKFCPVVFEGEAPAFGTPVRAGAAELGSVRSGMAGRAIALLRLDRALEALEKGEELCAGDKPVRLDPPAWLLLPVRDA